MLVLLFFYSTVFILLFCLCVLFIINLFCTHILQTSTKHSSDGCDPLLLSKALEAMYTGAPVLVLYHLF